MSGSLASLVGGSPFLGYAYAYPHKTAYRPIDPPLPLDEVWAEERRDRLFLYLHVPFCTMRCGFCNLFTLAQPDRTLVRAYLDALTRQAGQVAGALGADRRFARFAMGGGTPTYLSPSELDETLSLIAATLGVDAGAIPSSVECSPDTADRERLAVLREAGFDRVSIGIQRFDEARVRALGRPQKASDVRRALEILRELGFPTLNVDLIYGGPDESPECWRDTVREALHYRPEEVFLYPLYVRPLTGLGKREPEEPVLDERLAFYRAGRDLLLESGYRQLSMRYFRAETAPRREGPVYSCQVDGMVGLGAGARSYTRSLHYSTEYAVGRRGVRSILDAFVERGAASFGRVDYGCRLDADERRRRFCVQSLLLCEGLSRSDYRGTFGSDVLADLPFVEELETMGLAHFTAERLTLTSRGIELSDVIGPWLGSTVMRERMEAYSWR